MYIIHRVEKRNSKAVRGIQFENNRTSDMEGMFPLSDIDWSKTDQNMYLKKSDYWLKDIKAEIKAHGIQRYRNNAILLIDGFYSASPEFFYNKDTNESKRQTWSV